MKIDEIKEIVDLLEKSSLNKLRLKKDDFELLLEKSSAPLPMFSPQLPIPESLPSPVGKSAEEKITEKSNDYFITSPMVGTFYSTPAPNDPPFVKVGDIVDKGTVICIIEAMKVMNEVKAGVKGRIKELLCKATQPVEFGTKLFRIEPL